MINAGRIRKYLYKSSEAVYIGVTMLYATMGWIMSLDGEEPWTKEHPILWRLFEYIQNLSLYIYIAAGALAVLAFFGKRLGDPWLIEKLKFILNGYQRGAFAGDDPVLRDRDRVTIFKHTAKVCTVRHWSSTRLLFPWGRNPIFSNYLVPILRSGHISQRSNAAFFASDDLDKVEGVAGRAWAENRPIVLNDLPDLTSKSLARDKTSYARSTFTDVGMVEKALGEGKKLPRSIAAIPIESCGRVWGVVVLDSRNPVGVTTDSVNHYSLTVALIGELLERL